VSLDRTDAPAPRLVVRLPEQGWLGGVCAGIGSYLGVPPVVLRLAFVILATWRLTGVLAYFLVWLIVPLLADAPDAPGLDANTRAGLRTPDRPVHRQSAAEWGQLIALGLLGAGLIWIVQRAGWGLPANSFAVGALASAGLAVVWWQADHASTRDLKASGGPFAWLVPVFANGATALALVAGLLAAAASVVVTAMLLPLGEGAVVSRTLAALGLALVGLAALAAPWLLRVQRALVQAREAKIVSDARADMAAHLHDSVLQTLALIQKQASDPREVTRLARRQERELRAWLYGAEVPQASLKAALADAAQEIEDNFPVNVEFVAVGDADLTPKLAELVKATREAILNAAKHSGAASIDVYVEAEPDRVEVFVRDRGRGFDPDAVADGRLGISKSIMERMQRHGGTARLRSSAETGTEVTLEMTP
jgi:signal transduction histidine kinase/phage shock protein PspC (stress-responsive transcriptional regulator)